MTRTICVAVAVLLKPTVALPLMVLVIFSDKTRLRRSCIAAAVYAAVSVALLLAASIPTGMRHWAADLHGNVAFGMRTGMSPSRRISPSNVLLDLANLPGYFTENHGVIVASTFIIVGILVTFLGVAAVRLYRRSGASQATYAALVPSVAIITLLPLYHRFCDVGLILFVIPWLIQRFSNQIRPSSWIVAPILGLLYFSWERRMHLDRLRGGLLRWSEFLYYRGDALLILILAGVLVTILYRESRTKNPKVGPVLRAAS